MTFRKMLYMLSICMCVIQFACGGVAMSDDTLPKGIGTFEYRTPAVQGIELPPISLGFISCVSEGELFLVTSTYSKYDENLICYFLLQDGTVVNIKISEFVTTQSLDSVLQGHSVLLLSYMKIKKEHVKPANFAIWEAIHSSAIQCNPRGFISITPTKKIYSYSLQKSPESNHRELQKSSAFIEEMQKHAVFSFLIDHDYFLYSTDLIAPHQIGAAAFDSEVSSFDIPIGIIVKTDAFSVSSHERYSLLPFSEVIALISDSNEKGGNNNPEKSE